MRSKYNKASIYTKANQLKIAKEGSDKMVIDTKHFGSIDINDEKIITFVEGIPGFPDQKKYILISDENENSPFCWLQCIDDPDLAFPLMNPLAVCPTYSPDVSTELIQSLGEPNPEDLLIYAILVVPEDITKMTVNLKAPVIIHTKTKKGLQIISDNEEYSVRHYVYEEIQKLQPIVEKGGE